MNQHFPTLRASAGYLCAFVVSIVLLTDSSAQEPQALEVELPEGRFVGLPIHWTSYDGVLMESSGRFHAFEMNQLHRHRLLPDTFRPQTLTAARQQLIAELGPTFDTLIAGPYVIAAPRGEAERWQSRFTALFAGYVRYFEVRGWKLRRPDFPLCVIVFPDRDAFRRYAMTETSSLPEQAAGSYFPRSNRCVLYQLSSSRGIDWSQTEATIVHEAVHQIAYNTGVHERLFENPLWVVEGLATMFETPAVYDLNVARSSLNDRMHPTMISQLQPLLESQQELQRAVEQLIEGDGMFRTAPYDAYALGWAMTFALTERMPREYGDYVQLQAARRFGPYASHERYADFRSAFEIDPATLAIQLQRLFRK